MRFLFPYAERALLKAVISLAYLDYKNESSDHELLDLVFTKPWLKMKL